MTGTVRRLEPDEWPRLRDVRLRALADAPYAFGSTHAGEVGQDDEWWAARAKGAAWFVSTTRDGSGTDGLIAGIPTEDPAGRAVVSMWVAPGRRGSGVAGALLDALERWARAGGATSLVLGVVEDNARARRFYEGRGFTPTGGREPLRSNPTADIVEMRLALRPARLRFAPSPAGELHVGHARNAVLTWALSRQLSGDYFVRFENTDGAKEVAGSRDSIIADLRWLGLLGRDPPSDQADMTDAHRAALQRLTDAGCTYADGAAVRFRTPSDGTVGWDDLVRGSVSVRNDELPDPVLVRSSGRPTFFLASTVDDVDDAVTHVLRATPMLATTATQIHVWRALGVEPPAAGHVPLVTGPGGAPLRVGATAATVRAVRERGVTAAALLVYLAVPEAASWKEPPAALEDVLPAVALRRVARHPLRFDLDAVERLSRRLIS